MRRGRPYVPLGERDNGQAATILAAVVYEQGPVLPVSEATLERAMRGELEVGYAKDGDALILTSRARK